MSRAVSYGNRLAIDPPNTPAYLRHLGHRLMTLLALHDQCRASVVMWGRALQVGIAIEAVRQRIADFHAQQRIVA